MASVGTFLVGRVEGTCGNGFCEAAGIGGTSGADEGIRSARLSLTDLSFGIPPAKMSPSCGGAPGIVTGGPEEDGTARLAAEDGFRSRSGLDLSMVTAFFNLIPLWISPKRASLPPILGEGEERFSIPPPGGGGGGGGGPAIVFVSCRCKL